VDEAVSAGLAMAADGADAIDVGGESTRPGSQPVSPDEQIRRVVPVIRVLAGRFGADGPGISIDTQSARVAEAAITAGARLINDVSALTGDPAMAPLAADSGAGVILMHMKGTPADMQHEPVYADVVGEVRTYLAQRIEAAVGAGVARPRLMADPGIGFGKTAAHNLELLRRVSEFASLGVPLFVGPSRKRFIADITGALQVPDRLAGTIAAVCACVLAGVECVRVHDVPDCRRAVDLCAAIRGSRAG
jgi:dihydropteroate synthase